MDTEAESYYSIAGISRNSTSAEIKTAYRKFMLLNHPDKTRSMYNAKEFIRVQKVFDTLLDANQKALYDETQDQDHAGSTIPVSDSINQNEMSRVVGPEGDTWYEYLCRCGEKYFLEEDDDDDEEVTAIVQCSGCSLYIEVVLLSK